MIKIWQKSLFFIPINSAHSASFLAFSHKLKLTPTKAIKQGSQKLRLLRFFFKYNLKTQKANFGFNVLLKFCYLLCDLITGIFKFAL